MRKVSWGQNKYSLIDRTIEELRHKKILKYIKKGSNILDLGCGYNANLLKNLLNKGLIKSAFGLDLSVNNKNKNIILIKGRSDKRIPLQKAMFDVVTALALIEHVKNPHKMLRESYRLLKDNGKLILTTPSHYSKSILEFLAFRVKLISEEEISDHKRYYDIHSLKSDLIKAGFKEKNIEISYFQLGLNIFAIAIK